MFPSVLLSCLQRIFNMETTDLKKKKSTKNAKMNSTFVSGALNGK